MRLLVDLYDRYRTLLRGLEDEGIDTSMSELVHALLDQGPEDVPAAIEVLRRWRRASSEL